MLNLLHGFYWMTPPLLGTFLFLGRTAPLTLQLAMHFCPLPDVMNLHIRFEATTLRFR